MAFEPTENQRKVMEAEGNNQIVSASAGSGKTTVMVELIADRVVSKKLDLDKILLITFTNSATNDMKLKLSNKLSDIIKNNPSSYLKKQYDKVSFCKISTIDKLCQDIVKQYFYAVDVSPNFNVLSKEDMKLIRDKAFDKTLKRHLDAGDDKVMDLSLMLLKKRSQETLQKLVYACYDFLSVQSNVDAFRRKAEDLLRLPIEHNPVVLSLNEMLNKANNKLINDLMKIEPFAFNEQLNAFMTKTFETIKTLENVFCLKDFVGFPKCPKLDKQYKELENEINISLKEYNQSIEELKSDLVVFDVKELTKIISSTSDMIYTLLDFTSEFEQEYIVLKRENNSYEFNDIEHFALQILNIDKLRDDIIENIEQIFVDEYQDVNELQDCIIGKLSKGDNLFMVGDMKQSIYGFRLCAPYIFIDKYYRYLNGGGGEAHKLNDNFRSNPKILKFVNDIFNIAMTKENGGIDYLNDGAFTIKDSEMNEILKPVNIHLINNKREKLSPPSDIYSVANQKDNLVVKSHEEEGNEILSIVLELLNSKIYDKSLNSLRKVTYSDIAILFRYRSNLYDYVGQKLAYLGVPTTMDFKIDIFDSFIAKFINSALRLVLAFNDDISLATVMRFDGFDFTDDELSQIRLSTQKEFFYESVLAYQGELKSRIDAMIDFFEDLRKKSTYLKVSELINEIDGFIGLQNILLSKSMGANLLITYRRFVDYVSSLQYNSNLVEYLLYVQKLNESKEAVVAVGGGDAITISTIHSSKGLEYPIVILGDAGTSFKDKSRAEPIIFHREGVGTYYFDLENNFKMPSLTYNYLAKCKRKDELNEELRLLYVALTRPKNILYITASVNLDNLQKEGALKTQSYIRYILDGVDKNKINSFITSGEYEDEDMCIRISSEKPLAKLKKKAENINEELKDLMIERINFKYEHMSSNISYKTSVTELSSIDSPHTYSTKMDRLLISDDEIEVNELGTLYHKVFELVDYLKADSSEDITAQMKQLGFSEEEIELIDVNLILNIKKQLGIFGDNLTLDKEKRFLYKAPYNTLVEGADIEDEVLLQGVIDLIITDKNGYKYIVDYKLTSVNDENIVVDRYKKQLQIYSKSLQSALDMPVKGAYLYLIRQGRLVKVF